MIEAQAAAAVGREHAGGLVFQEAGENGDAAPRQVTFEPGRQAAQRPRQDVGDNQVIRNSTGFLRSTPLEGS